MKSLILLILLSTIYSCSSNSIKRVYYTYRFSKPNLTKQNHEKYYHFYDSKTATRTQTKVMKLIENGQYGYNSESKQLFILDRESPLGIKFVVDNVEPYMDRRRQASYYIIENGGGYLVKLLRSGVDYFQYYDKNFNKVATIKAELLISGNTNLNARLPFVTLENGLVYPAMFDGSKIVLKPTASTMFQGFEKEGDKLGYAVFKDGNGQTFYNGSGYVMDKDLFKYPAENIEIKVDSLLASIDGEAYEKGFLVIEKDLIVPQAHKNAVNLHEDVDLVQSLKTKKYYYAISKGYASKINLLRIKSGKLSYSDTFDTQFAAKDMLNHNKERGAVLLKAQDRKRMANEAMDKYMEDNKDAIAAKRRAREKKQADLDYRSAQAAQNSKNRSRFSDIDLTGGQGGTEADMIKNAKCRDAANRQNRHAGSIKYGCKDRYDK